ncbi:ubiquitin carboxyl-terminal hydrolase 24-like protein [Labeo rohita]|uniref:Ubiquitin carboxyl-terminal hydrolase 24-like protein n=1 Tax=Labeo rohita TaxID=84645 RepID=A0A498P3A1_LABRO|nr:ubiquitin carboxyl-terminal hydrolase 24-like protein [Labeo rohita]
MPSMLDEELSKEGLDTLSSRPFRNAGRQSGRQLSVCGTPEKSSYRQVSMSDRSSIRVEEIIPAARVAIQTMEVGDFTSTVACFMRLTWAAAAGRLDLVGSSQPIRETTNSLLPLGVRSRVSSTGSNCSSGSEGEVTTLQAGICVKQLCVSIKDTIIAREALSLLVTCLQLRCQQLSSFYNLPSVNDFIIDVLLGSPSGEIRRVACDQLYTLSQSDTSAYPDLQKPNLFLLKVVLTAQLPLWSPTSIMRGINQRFLLVGQAMPSMLDEELSKEGLDTLSSRPFRNAGRQSGRQLSVCGTPEKSSYRQVSMSDRSSIRVEEIIPAARVAIQTMEVGDFTSTVACFMRLTWAAAAGRLDLVGSSQPIRETTNSLLPLGVRSRVSSTGSNCSSGSEGEVTTLQAGICVKQLCVSIKDTIIAREALSLLVTCLQLRCQQLSSFYNLPSVNDFIIDVLLGSPSGEVSVCIIAL